MNTETVSIDYQRNVKFTNKWFSAQPIVKEHHLPERVRESELIKQLANDPLIELFCLVFEENSEIPSDLPQLYTEGLKILLKKWNNKHSIEGDRFYKNLSFQQKQDLLSQIALKTFEWGEYFFKKDLEQYIADYLCNLHTARIHPEALEVVSEMVLKSIEVQHGLLIEKSAGIYSFSDIRLHQYFTAKEIIECPEPRTLERGLNNLVTHMSETRWREVFLLVIRMLRNGNYLLNLMQQQTNFIVASDPEVRHFLGWLNQKSNSVKDTCKPSTFRAFYLEFILGLDSVRSREDDFAYYCDIYPTDIDSNHYELQNFSFSDQQKALLKQYYDANKLLLDCLNNARYVTRVMREEIKANLLVPFELSQ